MDEYETIAEYYNHVTIYRNRDDVGFFVAAAKESGGPVLEIGSGTGRVLLPTARSGIEITGLDASASMLAVCRRELSYEPAEARALVTLVEGDMRSFDLGRQFALITIPFRPFQHLVSVEEQLACLASVRRHLRPGGRFILDLFNPSLEALVAPVMVESAPESEFEMPDGRKVARRYRIVSRDRARQVNQIELIYDITHRDGSTERRVHAFPMRYLFRFEAEHLLERAGFPVEAVYSGYDKSPFGTKEPGELILVASLSP